MKENEIRDLQTWRKLSFQEKLDIKNHQWSQYDKQVGSELREEILKEFKEKLKHKIDDIKEIEFGWAGFDVLFIWVTIKPGKKVRLPRVYDEVFPVMKTYE